MVSGLGFAVFVFAGVLDGAQTPPAYCAPAPEKSWVLFLDQTRGFCFWYPPSYRRKKTVPTRASAGDDRQAIATLVSSEQLALSDPHERAKVTVYYGHEVFDLQKLIIVAPTGYLTPPVAQRYRANVFYYYGLGGGGVSYPDRFYYNLRGRTLGLSFDGQARR